MRSLHLSQEVLPLLCGIAGFTQKGWSCDPDRIRAATATLTHRGPDQQGVFSSRLCSLGATRLKILDLAAGDFQPITSSDGDTVIVFNGEIYNHLELRPELEKPSAIQVSYPLRYRDSAECLPGVGHCLFRSHARYVRGGSVAQVDQAARSSSRPHGHQATLLGKVRRRPALRF